MRILSVLLFALLSVSNSGAQTLSETQKTETLCKVWGFLKYYHTAVAQGDMDWDKVFVDEVDSLAAIHTAEELNQHYLRWIAGLGGVAQYPVQTLEFDKACNYNTVLGWIDSTAFFSPELTGKLKEIVVHRNTGYNRYVKQKHWQTDPAEFTNEKEYSEMIYPAKAYRLLCLARYWNIIEYYFPYKSLMDEQWSKVLTGSIPQFINAQDTATYVRAILTMVAKVGDSHATVKTPKAINHSSYILPVGLRVFADKAIVTEILNDSVAKAEDLQTGDVLLAINDTSVKDWISYKRKYISASNEAVIHRNLSYYLTMGPSPTVTVTFDRAGVTATKTVHRYKPDEIALKSPPKTDTEHYKRVAQNIGYINMGLLQPKEVKDALRSLQYCRAIIFDTRNYPKGTIYPICNYLAGSKTQFVTFSCPDFTYPGRFVCERPTFYGRERKAFYNGKIVILVNEQTQSHAEFTTMGLQALPNATVIGSQTAGADGNVADIVLPGGYKLYMTGLGVYYPDGRGTQRVGVKTDIYIEPTVEGIRAGKDEVLERALLYVNTGQ